MNANLFFAGIDPTVQQIGIWIGCAAAVLVILNQGMHFIKGLKDQPPASEVASMVAKSYVAKTDFDRLVESNVREHENLFSKIGGVERGANARQDSATREWREFVETKLTAIQADTNHGQEALHNRINEILAAVSELKGEIRSKR